MLRSVKATKDRNSNSGSAEFDEIQVESFKRLQFLEFGWKKLEPQELSGGIVRVGVGKLANVSEVEVVKKSTTFGGEREGDEWLRHNSRLTNGNDNGERIAYCNSKKDEQNQQNANGGGGGSGFGSDGILLPSPSETMVDLDSQRQGMSLLWSDINRSQPFEDSFKININQKSRIIRPITEGAADNGIGMQQENFYYSPDIPPPCSCACGISDNFKLEEITEAFSSKNKETDLSLPLSTHSRGMRPYLHIQQQQNPKQWESALDLDLDLIVPVTEANEYSTWTPVSTSTLTYPSSLDLQLPKKLQNSTKRVPKMSPYAQANSANYNVFCNSHHTILPEPSIISPGTCDGSISQSSPSQSAKAGATKRKHYLCPGLQLNFRKMCVVCGVLIATAGVVGVFFAMEMKTWKRKIDSKQDFVHKLLSEVPLIDGHNDLAWNLRKFHQNQLHEVNFDTDLTKHEPFSGSAWSHTDLIRLRVGGIGAQLWSAYVPCSAQHLNSVQIAVEQIDVIHRLVDKYPGSLRLVTSAKEVERSHQEKRIASLIGIEGGHAIGNSLAVLRMLYNLGARYLTLTHNCNTPWAGSASSENYLPERGGLTEFGKLVVLEMNRLGMMVDLAHVSFQTMKDGLAVSRAPVIFSHSAASALCNHSRNVPDEILRLVTANGGIIMVSFYNVFIACNETASMQDVIAHIEHIRKIAGVDHVGLGAGFDGINFVPVGLEDVSKYPDLIAALLLQGNKWSELDLKKLIGINFLRVFRQVESVRDDWKRFGVGPIEEWIPRDDLKGHRISCSYQGAS